MTKKTDYGTKVALVIPVMANDEQLAEAAVELANEMSPNEVRLWVAEKFERAAKIMREKAKY